MKHRTSKIIIGSALGVAAIAVTIDHTRHSLPGVEETSQTDSSQFMDEDTPCGLGVAPCSLDEGDNYE